MTSRLPHPALRPFVTLLWTVGPGRAPSAREIAVPTGEMHVVWRISEAPIRVFADLGDAVGRTFARGVVAGARTRFHVRDTSAPAISIGAQLGPGGAMALFGLPADELAGQHVAVGDLWPDDRTGERLAAASTPEQRLDVLESALRERLRPRAVHPAVTRALAMLPCPVERVVDDTGYSHRHLVASFRRDVGLTPKAWARLARFRRALRMAGSLPWDELALRAGYFDQSHLVREFRAIAGITPGAYVPRPGMPQHVPLGSDSSKTPPPRRG
jgi:AraC-like DNA-binding protein